MRTLLLTLVLAGCAVGPRMQRIQPGMNETTVLEVMGPADGIVVDGDYRALQWANRLMSNWSNDRADYWAVLVHDSVISFGPGQIRPGPRPNTLVLVPVGR